MANASTCIFSLVSCLPASYLTGGKEVNIDLGNVVYGIAPTSSVTTGDLIDGRCAILAALSALAAALRFRSLLDEVAVKGDETALGRAVSRPWKLLDMAPLAARREPRLSNPAVCMLRGLNFADILSDLTAFSAALLLEGSTEDTREDF